MQILLFQHLDLLHIFNDVVILCIFFIHVILYSFRDMSLFQGRNKTAELVDEEQVVVYFYKDFLVSFFLFHV